MSRMNDAAQIPMNGASDLAAGLADELGEAVAIDERKKLAEKTGGGYIHGSPPCSNCDWFFIHPDSIRSGRGFQSAVLDSSDC
jgi:hypothetical protein